MASIKKLSKLFSALAEQNVPRAEEAAVDIVRDEEQKGHHDAARLLKGSLRPNTGNGSSAHNGSYEHPVFGRLLSDALSPQVLTAHLAAATAPHLRLIVAWDSPVNAAVEHLWASRKIGTQLRVRLGTDALTGSRGGHKTYPLVERIYDLKRLPEGVEPADDLWLLEFSYEHAAEYYPGFTFSPQQRLAFAAELYDADEAPVSPQAALQALPIAASMVRFSAGTIAIRNPVILRTRV